MNQCYARLSQLTSIANNPLPENIDQNFQAIIDNHNNPEQSVSKIGAQIESLSKANSALEIKFSELITNQSQAQDVPKQSELSTVATATSIVDELSECKRKRNNIIIYNLPEAANQSTDEQSFADLCKVIVDADVNAQKLFRIGCKDSSRLLVCFTSEETKSSVLSNILTFVFMRISKRST